MKCDVVTVSCDDDAMQSGFAYTAGLARLGHPELVVVGLGAQHAQRLLHELTQRVRRGARLTEGDVVLARSINPPTVHIVEAPHPADGRCALQVVYADYRGAFPWDASYRYPSWLQRIPQMSAA